MGFGGPKALSPKKNYSKFLLTFLVAVQDPRSCYKMMQWWIRGVKDSSKRMLLHRMAQDETFLKMLSLDKDDVKAKQELAAHSTAIITNQRSTYDKAQSNTPNVSAASTSTCANADESSFVYLGGKIPIDASTLPNADLPIDPNMPALEDASDTLPNDGIFNGAYDDDKDVGAKADFNNMDNTIAVSPIPTLRIHKDYPKGQILGDPTSAVQTRVKIQKASSAQQALFSENKTRKGFKKINGFDLLNVLKDKQTLVNMLDEDVARLCLLIASELVFMGKEKRNFLTKRIMWLVDDLDA
ncbi:hypothetical protein Tco_0431500 [Tanacetum coccineum]